MRSEIFRGRAARSRVAASGLLALLLACASPAPLPVVARPPTPMPDLSPRTALSPDERPRPPALRVLEQTRFTLNVQDGDLRSVLLGLGRESPLNIVVDQEVTGTITADLKDVSLLQILDQTVTRRGYRYAITENLVRVYRTERERRIYHVDYPNYLRSGTSDLRLTGFIGAAAAIGEGGEESEDESLSSVQTTQTTDFWLELQQALRTMVFGSPDTTAEVLDGGEADQGGTGRPPVPARSVHVSRHAGLVSVTAESPVLDQVEDYLMRLAESTQRQVMIDTQFYEINLGDELDLGVDLELAPDMGSTDGVFARMIEVGSRAALASSGLAPVLTQGGLSFGFAREEIGLILNALAQQTDVRTVSTPRVATLNNHKAIIKVVRNEVFFVAETETIVSEEGIIQTTEFEPHVIPVGITLDVTPQISDRSEITMHIRPSVSEIVSTKLQPTSDPDLPQNGSLPVIDLRETDTVLRVEDGTTIVIGGLIQSREYERESRVPLLGDVPYLGALFKRTRAEERRTELVILMTPTVLDPPRIARVSADLLSNMTDIDSLRSERSLGSPWWRWPRGRSYGVQR